MIRLAAQGFAVIMSVELFQELFRNVETSVQENHKNMQNVLHERLRLIEELLSTTKESVSTSGVSKEKDMILNRLEDLEGHFRTLDEYLMGQVRGLTKTQELLELRLATIENSMKMAVENFQTINETIGSLQKRMDDEKPVEAAEVEAEIEEAEEAALNVEEEEVEEAQGEEEQPEEEEESPYEAIFTYKDRTYVAHKETNQVYILDEEGVLDPDAVIGTWSPKTEKLWMPEKGKWWDYKTNKYSEPKTKK